MTAKRSSRTRESAIRDRIDQVRRIGVLFERLHADNPSGFDLGEERTPVRMIADEFQGTLLKLDPGRAVT